MNAEAKCGGESRRERTLGRNLVAVSRGGMLSRSRVNKMIKSELARSEGETDLHLLHLLLQLVQLLIDLFRRVGVRPDCLWRLRSPLSDKGEAVGFDLGLGVGGGLDRFAYKQGMGWFS
jgi:hypothetical protein